MYKLILLLSLFPFFAHTSFTSQLSFETFSRVCIDDPDPAFMGQCNDSGINYEILETTLHTSQGEVITFETKAVLSGSKPLTQKNFNYQIICSSCSKHHDLSTTQLASLNYRFQQAFKTASLTSTFKTKRTRINGQSVTSPDSNNNGESFSESYKNFAEGTEGFVKVFDDMFDDGNNQMAIVKDKDGKAVMIIKIDGDSFTKITDLTKPKQDGDGNKIYTGTMSLTDADDYHEVIKSIHFYGGSSCKIHWTGTEDSLVAQVVCY
ncbi:hypothetical protein [Pseudoalteromonas mariniglutinosa]|uniref:hypothetical protein n=1 Tax=Pseudoalteromonas mariniglutinosa TaxID=206042 RepID=UPI00384DB46B